MINIIPGSENTRRKARKKTSTYGNGQYIAIGQYEGTVVFASHRNLLAVAVYYGYLAIPFYLELVNATRLPYRVLNRKWVIQIMLTRTIHITPDIHSNGPHFHAGRCRVRWGMGTARQQENKPCNGDAYH
jgi:hypothetical protein